MKLSLIGLVPLLSGYVCSFTITNRNAAMRKDYQLFADTGEIGEVSALQEDLDNEEESTSVTSFLKFIGPYPCLPLRFPNLATSSQRERNVTGISLDFVIDTAANTNTINGQVAQELSLESIGQALPGYGASGALPGAETYLLGDATLDMPMNDLFMTNLTASALPVSNPAAAGLLGVAFLNCFQGGVKFEWGGGIDGREPFITFYGQEEDVKDQIRSKTKVDIEVLDNILLPTVKLNVNGVSIPALIDTGSPVTVLNEAAAALVDLKTVELDYEKEEKREEGVFANLNPFKKATENFKKAQALSQAVQKGDVLLLMGGDGKQIELKRSDKKASLELGNKECEKAEFPSSYIYVGDLPGLKAMEGQVKDSPAAILGMDVIKRRQTMLYRGQQNAIYF